MRYAECILDLIYHANKHMTAEQIFLTLKEHYPSLVLATVYNNLNRLYQEGKIQKISSEGQPDRYDKNIRHDHLLCSCCGQLTDVSLPDFTKLFEKEVGFDIESYDLKIQYQCPKCKKNQQK